MLRARWKLVAVIGACVVAAAGAAAGVLATRGGSSSPALRTTGLFAPITVTRPKLVTTGGGLLSDPDAAQQTYLSTMVTRLPGSHHYRLTISNVSNLGYIDSFQWYPPVGVHIVRFTGSSAGHCGVSGLTGFGGNQFKTVVLYPNLLCTSTDLKPPSCTCLGDGGSVELSVVTDKPMTASGAARMVSARLALHLIPSYVQASTTTTAGG